MSISNPWYLLAIVGILAVYHLELLATFFNLSRLGRPIPKTLEEVYPPENRERLIEYISDSARQSVIERTVMLALLLLFWFSGGFGWVQGVAEGLAQRLNVPGALANGVIAIALVALGQVVVSLPLAAWHTFGLETRHGFNRTTPATFIADQIKSLVLAALLGLPLAAAIVWLFLTQPLAALSAWALVAVFSVLMTWLAPRLLMPLFLKFQPLPAGDLREAILGLAQKLQFPVSEVSIVDGSRRSSKANAFFAGFGKTRRIALFDTLLEKHSNEEILAILAHEIGHNKRRHVPVHLALSMLELGLLFGLLHFALKSPGFYTAFGVNPQLETGAPIGLGLVLFGIIYAPLGILTGLLGLAVSRKHEFEADAFAAEAMGTPAPLATSLKKLSGDHLSHPQPHPLMVWLHYSHPPMVERLGALEK